MKIHYQKLAVQEPFVVIQENVIGNEVYLREIPVSNIQDRSTVAVKFGGDWYPIANPFHVEHAALVAVAEAAGKHSEACASSMSSDETKAMLHGDLNAALDFLSAIRAERQVAEQV